MSEARTPDQFFLKNRLGENVRVLVLMISSRYAAAAGGKKRTKYMKREEI